MLIFQSQFDSKFLKVITLFLIIKKSALFSIIVAKLFMWKLNIVSWRNNLVSISRQCRRSFRLVEIRLKIPFHGICFFNETFSFFNLVSDFFSRWNFLKTGYFNKFIYLFLLHNLNNFVSFKTPVVERWLIEMKKPVAAPALLVLSRALFLIDRMKWMLRSRWWGRCPFLPSKNIYVSGPIFVKLAYDFNPSCLSPTFVREKVFSMEHMKLKRAVHDKLV